MASTVTAVAGATVAPPAVAAPDLSAYRAKPDGAGATSSTLDKDAFLKLLVAQLKYQDPMQPSSSEEFIATTAQFTVVEKLDELTKQGAANALVGSLTTASSLVGRTVSALQDGNPIEAVVLRSTISSGEVVLDTDKGVVRLNEIVGIGPSALTAAVPTTPPSPATPPAATPSPATPPPATSPPAETTTQTQENNPS